RDTATRRGKFHRIVQQIDQHLPESALTKQIVLSCELPKAAPWPDVLVDERRLRQVLINLLNNAVKFTPTGGRVTLKADLERPNAASAPAHLRLSVSDTGIGIALEDREKLFQPFIQVDGDLNRQHAGTGLGLALVKRIVEHHGGTVKVESELGQGSCFTIDIPCQVSAAVKSASLSLVPDLTAESPVLLLIDDGKAWVSSVSDYLKAKGYRIIVAKTVSELLSFPTDKRPDLCLIDIEQIQTGENNSIEQDNTHSAVLQAVLQQLQLLKVTIVVLTEAKTADDCDLPTGFRHCLSRSTPLRQLVTNIQQLLQDPGTTS
ncbi:MAG: ATP-binding protein, partial [Cyanobacteria bacterium J06632_22]